MEDNVTQDLSDPHRELLTHLLEMYIDGEELADLRCGKEVCEYLTELSSLEFLKLEEAEEEDGLWRVELELDLSRERAEELLESL
ncbi:MAG: hypothetical protein MUP63_01005 [Candidatus Nanohaloarchaeota archaeon QJJ-7]|nr:hypothetical protein [Candidatus Nanohaloarchaeota archaeon QJJ-7]